MQEVVFITAVGSVSILTQGKPPVMMEGTSHNMLAAENGSSFAVALDEASGADAQNSTPVLLAVAAGEENQDEKRPNAALTLVAAMLAFSPQPMMQGTAQAAEAQNAAAVQSGVQRAGFNEGQQVAGASVLVSPETRAGAVENEDALSAIMTDAQDILANEDQAPVYQKPIKTTTGMEEVQTEECGRGAATAA